MEEIGRGSWGSLSVEENSTRPRPTGDAQRKTTTVRHPAASRGSKRAIANIHSKVIIVMPTGQISQFLLYTCEPAGKSVY